MVYATGSTPTMPAGAAVGVGTTLVISEAPGIALPQQQEPYPVTTLASLPPQ